MLTRLVVSLLLALCGSLESLVTQSAADWPRWRGAGFDGRAETGRGLFSHPFRLQVRWRASLGPGYSGVVVAGGRAVTMFSDGQHDVLVSLDADNGREQWRMRSAADVEARSVSAAARRHVRRSFGNLGLARTEVELRHTGRARRRRLRLLRRVSHGRRCS